MVFQKRWSKAARYSEYDPGRIRHVASSWIDAVKERRKSVIEDSASYLDMKYAWRREVF